MGKVIVNVVDFGKSIEILTVREDQQLLLFDDNLPLSKVKRPVDYAKDEGEFIIYMIEQKWGVIDKKANDVLPCVFDDIWVVNNGFLAVKDCVQRIYRKDGKQVVLSEKYRVARYFPEINCAILEGLGPKPKDSVFALYSLDKMDYLLSWTDNIRQLGKIFLLENPDTKEHLIVGDFGFSKVDKVEHFEAGAMVLQGDTFILYDYFGDSVWKMKKRKP